MFIYVPFSLDSPPSNQWGAGENHNALGI